MRYLLYILIAAFLLSSAPGCTGGDQPQKATSAERAERRTKKQAAKKKPPSAVTAAKQEQKPSEAYSYSSAGKPDPFRPLIADTVTKLATDDDRNRDKTFLTPLQKYELKDLKLVAIVVTGDEPTAMLEDPTGYGYFVHKGTLIGPNDGVVERVTHTGVIIREKIYNSLGEIEPRISTLTIQHVE